MPPVDGSNQRPIIIKRVEEAHHGHHGGAWKVAYADFVTAMMAFFLLLWLLGSTTEEQRKGIADYFTPTVATTSASSGSNGVLGGVTISVQGALTSPGSSALAPGVPAGYAQALGGEPEAEENGNIDGTTRLNRRSEFEIPAQADEEELQRAIRDAAARGDQELLEELEAALEEERFAQTEKELRDALGSIPELQDLAQSVVIDRTPEGLRIQIVDQADYSMFPSGSAEMQERARELLALVTRAIADLPNRVSIRGHTDAHPFPTGSGRDNWILSAERANATRQAMQAAGLAAGRLANVVGLADTEPFVAEDPLHPHNRRMSIILLAEQRKPG